MSALHDQEKYRDSISTINNEGKRVWIYPKKPSGRFYNARTIVSIILLLILFITPFIKVSGHPFILLNILEREFILFGVTFGPHDFYIFVLLFIATIVFVILFTAIYGRIFCGWICPQTVFMEMVFRKIEYFIEGDFLKQRTLDQQEWNMEKFLKKGSKHIIFFTLSFIISNLFLSYIIGIDELFKIITDPPSEHLTGLIAITLFSGVFYFVFSKFREQACTIVCPYGRLQGVLLDKNSLVVAYDDVRGEPRGKIKKNEERTQGDCIDCHLCVDVCPTGIDIRNGIQLECVNCTACIDACDNVMDKINKPRGLVRYDSLNGIKERIRFRITPRIMSYSAVLTVLIIIVSVLLFTRDSVSVNILRTPGMLYQDQPDNKISNLYNINIVNKTFDTIPIDIKVKNIEANIVILGNSYSIPPHEVFDGKFMVVIDKDKIDKLNMPLEIGVYEKGNEVVSIKTAFLSHFKKEIK
ncbi:MAG TPA: cytochrome c oxidase accessory protein CcoG [Ignavibacteriaceae bacterium]|nr:cytochrome c oxidase accessory protein CcoG [Ignavibacteriaceae bacterium]